VRSTRLRGFSLNLAGSVVPLVGALAAVPVIQTLAGTERLGWLALIWTLVGYLGLLDMGLGRVLIRHFAVCQTGSDLGAAMALLWRVCRITGLATIAAGVVLAGLVLLWEAPLQRMAGGLHTEVRSAIWIVLAVLPAVVVSSLLRGALEGRQLFGYSNALKVVFGSLTFAAPMAAAWLAPTLPALAGAVAATRVIGAAAHLIVVRTVLPAATPNAARPSLRALLAEGGWMTATNAIGPLMVTFDRFVVAALVSSAAVAYYAVVQEVALRLLLVPMALAATVFPALAARSIADSRQLGLGSVHAGLLMSLPLCAALALLAQPTLTLWLGAEFARESAPIAAVLAIGLLANCIAQTPFTWIQARGRADLTGRLHLAELIPYAAVLLMNASTWGILGVAIAWSTRTIGDCILMFVLADRLALCHLKDLRVDLATSFAAITFLALGAVAADAALRTGSLVVGALLLMLQVSRSLRSVRRAIQQSTVASSVAPGI
jgi:O-antigen/teichoic acid export membrane protein